MGSLLHWWDFALRCQLDCARHGASVAELSMRIMVSSSFAMVVQGDGQMIDERFTPDSGFKLTSWVMKITDMKQTCLGLLILCSILMISGSLMTLCNVSRASC
ncbi:hypothetical protein BDA96_01G258700 [Sorghum bicolor]|uniref:Uncharacterized protein n=1 Tax=Sorghum bicolor TaxID=4558 RepID=A0A921S154_SORBI|nr:hypothetical protein BDA96_01G258700 [Sorghum bicolor]